MTIATGLTPEITTIRALLCEERKGKAVLFEVARKGARKGCFFIVR